MNGGPRGERDGVSRQSYEDAPIVFETACNQPPSEMTASQAGKRLSMLSPRTYDTPVCSCTAMTLSDHAHRLA